MRKVFLVPYFGKFPNYFQLWLDSCGRNNSFNWVILTDCSYHDLNIPINVKIIDSTIKDLESILQNKILHNIKISSPYKLCDFRPVYWAILDHFKIEYDFWGYCDTDLIFGNLTNFFPDEKIIKYDKILSNGHLTLYNSKTTTKEAYKLSGSKYKWKDIFTKYENIGFDEHHGINKIFESNNFKLFKDISIIADIDPQFINFNLYYQPFNEKEQFFTIRDGKVLQYYKKNKKIKNREFAYIHIQKRKMPLLTTLNSKDTFLINQYGFSNFNTNIDSNFQTNKEDINTKIKKFRTKLRFYKHKVLNVI